MSKNLSAKYHQENKKRLRKKGHERYQTLFKEEKGKSNNVVMNVAKICQKVEKINLLGIEKKYYIMRKSAL